MKRGLDVFGLEGLAVHALAAAYPGNVIPMNCNQYTNGFAATSSSRGRPASLTLRAQQQKMADEAARIQREATRLGMNVPEKIDDYKQPKETTVNEKELLPDISLTRVLKWAVVLLVAMALGSKVWEKFGAKVTAQLHKAIEAV